VPDGVSQVVFFLQQVQLMPPLWAFFHRSLPPSHVPRPLEHLTRGVVPFELLEEAEAAADRLGPNLESSQVPPLTDLLAGFFSRVADLMARWTTNPGDRCGDLCAAVVVRPGSLLGRNASGEGRHHDLVVVALRQTAAPEWTAAAAQSINTNCGTVCTKFCTNLNTGVQTCF